MRVRAGASAPAGARAGLIDIAAVDRPNQPFGRLPACGEFPREPANPFHEGGHFVCPLRRSVGRRKVFGGTGGATGALP